MKYIFYESVKYFSLLFGENGLDSRVHYTDVSIDSQRRELHKLAATNQITIIDEYIDAIESANKSSSNA